MKDTWKSKWSSDEFGCEVSQLEWLCLTVTRFEENFGNLWNGKIGSWQILFFRKIGKTCLSLKEINVLSVLKQKCQKGQYWITDILLPHVKVSKSQNMFSISVPSLSVVG